MSFNNYKNLHRLDISEIEKAIQSISKENPTIEELKLALSLVDLTSLDGKDTEDKILTMLKKAETIVVAAVCVYPVFVETLKKNRINSALKIASVAGAFPSGQMPLDLRLQEAKFAIEKGADEIDMVISRGKIFEENYDFVFEEIQEFKKVCGDKKLKVILETGELASPKNINIASQIAIDAGADFIKTSTGKISTNATIEAVCIMLFAIKNHFEKTGKKVGIKPSGGISNGEGAVQYIRLTKNILGDEWLNSNYFRFGASRLVDNLLLELNNGINSEYDNNNY